MEIICPECKFSRTVPDEKIPATAEMATCPKCGVKFRFRTATPTDHTAQPEQPAQPQAPQQQPEAPQQPPSPPQQPPLPYEDEPPQPMAGSDTQGRQERGDVFAGLEAMGRRQEERRPGDQFAEGYEDPHEAPGARRRSRQPALDDEDYYNEEDVPWERLDAYGFFPGLFNTIKRAMLQPGRFFGSMPLGGGFLRPLAFYVLLSLISAMAQFLFQAMGLSMMSSMQGSEADMVEAYQFMGMGAASAFALLLYPIMLTVVLYVTAGLHHLFLRLFQAASAGFEGTFRALAYGSAPTILGVVPIVGWAVASIWMLVVTFIGLKHIHRTSYARVLTAFCAMFFTFLLLIGFLAYFIHSLVPA